MPNTPRTLSALLALAADNDDGDISAQDLRDMLVSLNPSRGSLYLGTPAATTIANANTWTRLAGVTVLDPAVPAVYVTMPENGALESIKDVVQVVLLTASVTFSLGNNNRQIAFTFGKNGTPLEHCAVSSFYGAGSGGHGFGVMFSTLITLAFNDQIELYVKNVSHTDSITATEIDFSLIGLIT